MVGVEALAALFLLMTMLMGDRGTAYEEGTSIQSTF